MVPLQMALLKKNVFQWGEITQEVGLYMGVTKNTGTPKWMVKIMEKPIKMDDLGGKPPIFGKHPYKYIKTHFLFKAICRALHVFHTWFRTCKANCSA